MRSASEQHDLFGGGAQPAGLPPGAPEGFRLEPGLIDPAEEAALLTRLAELPFAPFQFRGFEGRRRVVSFGLRYDFNAGGLAETEPIPEWLHAVRDRAAAFAGVAPSDFRHLLINEYRPGAPIGWHRDRPVFERVAGVSLGAPASLRFRLRDGPRFRRWAVELPPRSAYLLQGDAREVWEHSLPEAAALRYSLTFRNLRPKPGGG